ncbi:MAG: ribosomal protein S18-alanine N-acetyltransferase [Microbacteriaceae bacterium]|nr:ribosomal protein S18-alanine N-acetyltransferase [Microbacteriaceae bacterium]
MSLQHDVQIRPATEDDLDAMWVIEQEVFGAQAWTRDLLQQELTGDYRAYRALVDADGRTIGYAGLLAVGGDGDIQTIAVDAGARGKGYGRTLMNELLDEATRRDVRQVFLEVRADNPVARRLYESLGFAELGVRPQYYQPEGIDAIVMKLEMGARR